MSDELLLVGSIPLETVEEVIRTFGGPLGPYLPAIPDGEVGDRRWWVLRLSYQVFNGHPDLETLKRPAPDNGVERLVPRDRKDMWQFRVKSGVDRVRFGDPGWRLGFARDAINSYFIFDKLRGDGVVPKELRFQVSLPLVNSVITTNTFPTPGDLGRVRPGYEAALAAEIAKIVEKIPNKDLALQWDCSWEITDVYGGIPGISKEGAIERNIAQIRNLSRVIPEDVLLGFHFCFGTFGGWPRFAPDDLGAAVDLANAARQAAGRRVDWIHIPTLDRLDDEFYAPLRNLRPDGSRVYLGLIHSMQSLEQRMALARKYLPEFGVAAYCGLGRNPASSLPQAIQDHIDAVGLARKMKSEPSSRS